MATKVDGGTLEKVDLGSVALYYGVNGGKLVVTDSANALAELAERRHLTGDDVFKEAKDGAGMPDRGQGFLFVDLKDAVPASRGFAQLANQTLPRERRGESPAAPVAAAVRLARRRCPVVHRVPEDVLAPRVP